MKEKIDTPKKTCGRCTVKKAITEFYRNKDGYLGRRSICIECTYLYTRSDKAREKGRKRREEERKTPNYREVQRYAEEKYRASGKARLTKRKRHFHRYNTDVAYRLKAVLRSRLWAAIKSETKSGSAVSDLGCSIPEFKTYLENLFEPKWSWDNYGEVWEIDHIIPLSDFDLTREEQVKKACHYKNLRPLSIRENRGRN